MKHVPNHQPAIVDLPIENGDFQIVNHGFPIALSSAVLDFATARSSHDPGGSVVPRQPQPRRLEVPTNPPKKM